MDTITADALLRHTPARQQIRAELMDMDATAVARFDAGSYALFFDERHGLRYGSEAIGWARAYLKNHHALERASRLVLGDPETRHLPTATPEEKHSILSIASEQTRRTQAGVCIDIAPPFERFFAARSGATPPVSGLVTTSAQAQVMERACELARLSHHGLLTVLADAHTVDGFLFLSLSHVLGRADVTDSNDARVRAAVAGSYCTSYVRQADAYLDVVRKWLGRRNREVTLFAVQLAAAGTTVQEICAFSESHVAPEYALALTGASVSR